MPILYKTTCTVNGKFYIGVHSKGRDDYLGSGVHLKRAIRKYGKDKFIRETLETFETIEDAYAREAEIVTKELVDDPMCLNIIGGGKGGKHRRVSEETRHKMSKSAKKRCETWTSPTTKGHTQETKEKMSKTRKERGIAKGKNNPMYGKKRSDVSERNRIPKRWMYKGGETRLVPVTTVDEMISNGYKLGRPT